MHKQSEAIVYTNCHSGKVTDPDGIQPEEGLHHIYGWEKNSPPTTLPRISGQSLGRRTMHTLLTVNAQKTA